MWGGSDRRQMNIRQHALLFNPASSVSRILLVCCHAPGGFCWPRRQREAAPAPACIISTAQQASPKVIGHIEPVRAQFIRSSILETTNSADELVATAVVPLLWAAATGASTCWEAIDARKACESCLNAMAAILCGGVNRDRSVSAEANRVDRAEAVAIDTTAITD